VTPGLAEEEGLDAIFAKKGSTGIEFPSTEDGMNEVDEPGCRT
jgi:hypothetical protein